MDEQAEQAPEIRDDDRTTLFPNAISRGPYPEQNTHAQAQFLVTRPDLPVGSGPPAAYIPPELLKGAFAHSVRTYIEGGIICLDFTYNAPVNWRFDPDGTSQAIHENIVTARVLMPFTDFEAWIRATATSLGFFTPKETQPDAPTE